MNSTRTHPTLAVVSILALITLMTLPACLPAGKMEGLHLDRIELPEGFEISLLTDQVPGARAMTQSPQGILYVGSRRGEQCLRRRRQRWRPRGGSGRHHRYEPK